jgi:hypothetical protein
METPKDPELEEKIRAVLQRACDRPSPADNPIARLLSGSFTLADAAALWTEEDQQSLLFFTEVLAPHLMESCADLDARVVVWNTIYPVFGRGRVERSYPHLLQRFLQAIGSAKSPEHDGVLRKTPAVEERRRNVLARGFIEAIAVEFLPATAVVPQVFPRIAAALTAKLGLNAAAVRYFEARAEEAPRSVDAQISLLVRYCRTPEDQRKALAWLEAGFDRPALLPYACRLPS